MVVAGVLASGLLLRGVELSRRVLATTFESDRNPGVGIRVSAWRDALRIFRAHPATGTGIGTFDEFTYRLPDTTADPQFRLNGWHAHNVYLHLLAETGVIGLTAWCVLWYAIVARLVRASRTTDAERRLATTGVLGAVLAFLALSTTEVLIGARVHASLRMNLTIGLVVVLGLGLATSADRR
jgi:O-antigen ligase